MNGHIGQSVAEVYQDFILAKTAEGVSDITIRNYHQHLHNISKYLDIEQPDSSSLQKRLGKHGLWNAGGRACAQFYFYLCAGVQNLFKLVQEGRTG